MLSEIDYVHKSPALNCSIHMDTEFTSDVIHNPRGNEHLFPMEINLSVQNLIETG